MNKVVYKHKNITPNPQITNASEHDFNKRSVFDG